MRISISMAISVSRWLAALVGLGCFAAAPAFAQSGCASATAWSVCDFVFELQPGESQSTVQLKAEFRSPHHKTYLMPAFHDSGNRWVIRFTPTEGGAWEYKITSNVKRLDETSGQFSAGDFDSPGFLHVANLHHFKTENGKQHLWMSTALDSFTTMPKTELDQDIENLASAKFTHVRVKIEPGADLNDVAERLRAVSAKGLTADLVMGSIPEDRAEREKYLRDLVARLDAFNITWMGVPAFENSGRSRQALKETGALIKSLDPYQHPRTTLAATTSAPLLNDGWMDLASYGTPDPNVGAVEHQLYQVPGINTGIQSDRDLWNATMNGQYPAAGSGKYMTAWFEFMSGNRYWELEPYFDVDGGRALALDGVEYIVYVENPGPVELTVEKHGYNVAWIDPATGARTKAKDYNGEHFTGEPPDRSHPWVLHVSRESHKEGMLKSYFFDSRPVPVQEVELSPAKVPFEIVEPAVSDISLAVQPRFELKIKRETRGTRTLLAEWTAEIVEDGEGYRVVGTGKAGTLNIPKSIVKHYPAVLAIRVSVLNAFGKAYIADKVYRLNP